MINLTIPRFDPNAKREVRYTDAYGRFWLMRPANMDNIHRCYAYYQSLYSIGYARVRNRIMGLWLEAGSYDQLDFGSGWYDPSDEVEFAWAIKIRPDYIIVKSDQESTPLTIITTSFAPSIICFWHEHVDADGHRTGLAFDDDRYAR